MNKEKIIEFYTSHRGEINGAAIGLVIALTVLIFGVLKALFVAFCVGIGYYIGKRLSEDKDYLKNLLDRVLPPGTYR
ncbi:MAG: DUF2273 domain-containing protein [Clostridia bacterium]|nr:DUF2273 domain-containing protein [Clostridia bacterium]